MLVDDTIAAIATPRAPGGRGIVRLSGPEVVSILAALEPAGDWGAFRFPRVVPGNLRAGDLIGEVPCDVYLWPTARSYTRQPTAEIHTIGSLPILDALLAAVCAQGARLAQPGEFTLRAFLAGRLDLTQAEAVLGVIDAANERELQTALSQLAGGLAQPLHALRSELLDLLAHLEAGLDFVEEDIEFITTAELTAGLARLSSHVQAMIDQIRGRRATGTEPRVVLRGLPNAGKSSLFNALVGSDQSLVSATPATTRDYLSAVLELGGRPVQIVDTAGVEEPSALSPVRQAAQQMTAQQSQSADLELLCVDTSRPLAAWEVHELAAADSRGSLIVGTKGDLPRAATLPEDAFLTSSRSGAGLAELRHAVVHRLEELGNAESAVVASTAVRCQESLRRADESLARARGLVEHQGGEELLAVELRVALDELGQVAGVVYTDDILDRVFSRFCIGK